jgi:hypothetical protein
VTLSPGIPGSPGNTGPVRTPRAWVAQFRPRPVTLSSPYPPAECGRRLERVTVRNQFSRYLGSRAGLPALRLLGQVSPARVRVARLPENIYRRNSLLPWFDGVIETAPDGGTILRGTVAPPPGSLPVLVAISGVWAVLLPFMVVAGMTSVVSGSGPGLPFLLAPGFFAVGYVSIVVTTPRQIRSQTQRLLRLLSLILGATATMES